ncbi:hypothetical protein KKF86_08890, partial [bacterium]|nr:hypothetical protein [bacterium]
MNGSPTIIGIDGGATKVIAHIVKVSQDGRIFILGKQNSVKEYHNYPDFQPEFKPVNLSIQLEQIRDNNIVLTPDERKQSKAYYNAFIDSITNLVELTKAEIMLIGIGMPGIKTANQRGIAVMANGPRMPNLTIEIEQRLSTSG